MAYNESRKAEYHMRKGGGLRRENDRVSSIHAENVKNCSVLNSSHHWNTEHNKNVSKSLLRVHALRASRCFEEGASSRYSIPTNDAEPASCGARLWLVNCA